MRTGEQSEPIQAASKTTPRSMAPNLRVDAEAAVGLDAMGDRAQSSNETRSVGPVTLPASVRGPSPNGSRRKKREGLPTRGGAAPFKIDPDTYYTPGQWAEMSGYTVKTLATLRSRREMFPYVKLGGTVFYKGSQLIETLNRNAVEVGHQNF